VSSKTEKLIVRTV